LNLAKKWGIQKFDNQIELLKRQKKTRAEKKDDLERSIDEIGQLKERMN
jgi:CRISPR/Cas system-associated endonuclease Cas1